jgi:hypothetical protein
MAFKMKGFPSIASAYGRSKKASAEADVAKSKQTSDIVDTAKSVLPQNDNITTKKEERKIKRGWSGSRKAKYKETEKGMKELGIDKIERKYRDLRYPYQDDKKIKMLKRDIAELEAKAANAGKVNKKRILNKIKKLKAKLPKRVQ